MGGSASSPTYAKNNNGLIVLVSLIAVRQKGSRLGLLAVSLQIRIGNSEVKAKYKYVCIFFLFTSIQINNLILKLQLLKTENMTPPPRKQNSIGTGQMILCQFSVCLKNHVYLKGNSFNAFKHIFGGPFWFKNKSTLVPKLSHRPMSSTSSFLLEV